MTDLIMWSNSKKYGKQTRKFNTWQQKIHRYVIKQRKKIKNRKTKTQCTGLMPNGLTDKLDTHSTNNEKIILDAWC